MRSLDDYDEELLYNKKDKIKVGLLVSFKSMSAMTGRIVEETGEYDSKYPKSELLKIWGAAMGVFFFLFLASYGLFAVATLPFMMFYGYAVVQVIKAWKRFKYACFPLIAGTLLLLVLEFMLGIWLQGILFA